MTFINIKTLLTTDWIIHDENGIYLGSDPRLVTSQVFWNENFKP